MRIHHHPQNQTNQRYPSPRCPRCTPRLSYRGFDDGFPFVLVEVSCWVAIYPENREPLPSDAASCLLFLVLKRCRYQARCSFPSYRLQVNQRWISETDVQQPYPTVWFPMFFPVANREHLSQEKS